MPGEGVGEASAKVLNAGVTSTAQLWRCGGVAVAVLPEVHYHLFSFVVVESELVLPAPRSQPIHLLPVC